MLYICDDGLDLHIIFTTIHIVHIIREVEVSCKIVRCSQVLFVSLSLTLITQVSVPYDIEKKSQFISEVETLRHAKRE